MMLDAVIGGVLVAMFTGVLGMLIGSKGKITKQDFESHKDSPNPHIACPVHKQQLTDIEKKIDRLDAKIDRLLDV
jgi:hypothetical protein